MKKKRREERRGGERGRKRRNHATNNWVLKILGDGVFGREKKHSLPSRNFHSVSK